MCLHENFLLTSLQTDELQKMKALFQFSEAERENLKSVVSSLSSESEMLKSKISSHGKPGCVASPPHFFHLVSAADVLISEIEDLKLKLRDQESILSAAQLRLQEAELSEKRLLNETAVLQAGLKEQVEKCNSQMSLLKGITLCLGNCDSFLD